MNRIDKHFRRQKELGKGVLITYFPIGEPEYDSLKLAETYIENGSDLFEIGLPVPDPFSDGKVVSDSMKRVREAGRDLDWIFREVRRLREAFPEFPMQAFSYKQIFDQKPEQEFIACCKEAGIDGMLITDLNEKESRQLDESLPKEMHNIHFVPYQCSGEQIEFVRGRAEGYIFLQAVNGPTGTQTDSVDPGLKDKIAVLHEAVPGTFICPGFGISTPQQCQEVMKMGGDGVIIGSRMVKAVSDTSLEETGRLLGMLKAGLTR